MKNIYLLRLKEAFIDSMADVPLSYILFKMSVTFVLVGLSMSVLYWMGVSLGTLSWVEKTKEGRKGRWLYLIPALICMIISIFVTYLGSIFISFLSMFTFYPITNLRRYLFFRK